MKLTMSKEEVKDIVLEWAQNKYGRRNFNSVSYEGYGGGNAVEIYYDKELEAFDIPALTELADSKDQDA